MGPIDYTLNVQQPFQSAMQGYQFGAQVGSAMQGQRQAQAVQQQTLAQQQAMQADLRTIISNPNATPSDFAALTLKYPSFAEPFKQAASLMSEDQKASTIKFESQIYAALDSGATELAKTLLQERADKMEAAGDKQGATDAKRGIQLIDVNPTIARNMLGNKLVSMDEKLAGSLSALGGERRNNAKFPTDLRKDRAEAVTAEATAGIKTVEAANAPTRVGLENANIQSTIEDRAAGQEIARGQLGVAQENSMTGRGNLVLDQQKQAATIGEKKKTESLAAQDQVDTINSSLASVQTLSKHPAIDSMVGTFRGQIASKITGTDRKDIESLVETVKSQQFLTGIKQMQGMGALSNAEGDKIGSAVASLSLDQSAPAFKNALGVIRTTLEKAQAKAVASGKLPETGGAFVMKIPRIGNVTESDINKLLTKNPGSTREQAIKYLESLANRNGGATGGY